MRTTFAVLLSLYAVSVFSGESGDCPSGVNGHKCSDYNPCTPGNDCRGGRCCRQLASCSSGIDGPACSEDKPCNSPGYACKGERCCAVCPKGRKEGGPCNRTPGEPRCPPSYGCINDLCCDATSIPGLCPLPNSDIGIVCPPWIFPPECSDDKGCRKGAVCCDGPCGTRYCYRGWAL